MNRKKLRQFSVEDILLQWLSIEYKGTARSITSNIRECVWLLSC